MKRFWQAMGVCVVGASLVVAGVGIANASGNSSGTKSFPTVAQAKPAPNATRTVANTLAPSTPQTTFTTVAPCRVADTRLAIGRLSNGATQAFQVAGTGSLAGQGGNASGCNVPSGAVAVAATITAVAKHNGYLSAWAAGDAQPISSFLSYGSAFNASSGGVVQLSSTGQIDVYNHGGPAYVVIDVTGYYSPEIEAFVQLSPVFLYSATSHVLSVNLSATGQAEVQIDHDVNNCSETVTASDAGDYVEGYTDGDYAYVSVWQLNSSGEVVYVNDGFNLTITC